MQIDELIENFDLFDDWEDRYNYIIELGRTLPPMDEALKTPASKVEGCTSQVWFVASPETNDAGDTVLRFIGDSDALIVKGLIAILFAIHDGKSPEQIKSIDAESYLTQLGLDQHLAPSRTNGLYAMLGRIRDMANRLA